MSVFFNPMDSGSMKRTHIFGPFGQCDRLDDHRSHVWLDNRRSHIGFEFGVETWCSGYDPDLIPIDEDPIVRTDGITVTRESTLKQIVSPDAPITTNEYGGSQSDVPVRFDLIDAKALFEMAKVLDHGAKKYGANNWRRIPVDDHLNHLLMHVYAYLAGDRSDDHLSHALCRATFALGVKLEDEE